MKKILFATIGLCLSACGQASHNLTIEVDVPTSGLVVSEAQLICADYPIVNEETNEITGYEKFTYPESWCGAKPINLPATSIEEKIVLLFNLEPSPKSKGIHFEDEPSPFNDSPSLIFVVNGKEHGAQIANIKPDFWRGRTSLKDF